MDDIYRDSPLALSADIMIKNEEKRKNNNNQQIRFYVSE